ncbi:MAG TPA: homoserine dehydrogenase [Actinomycetes bacterium]|jgi:homoserine dehydrogenase|nr:homoserine dehydrogenase [Actinomycetes bacterium]
MLGCGVVGTGVARLLVDHAVRVADRAGAPILLHRVAVRDVTRKRDPAVDPTRITGRAADVVTDPEVDVVVEVMGGIEPARSLIVEALRLGKPVVTANKELLATHGEQLFEAADAAAVDLKFEAAVAGAIPIIHPLKESLAGDRLRRVLGIVNGTTNYVLWRMASTGASYAEALAEATELGYAEPDPSADVEGFDAAAKCAILASLAFNTRVVASDVYREGITDVTAADIAAAARMGYTVKLLAIAEEVGDEVSVRVHPAMVPDTHPLAGVTEAYNAVFVEGDAVGQLMFYGRGAGGLPTGSAVLGDLVGVARNRAQGARGVGCTCVYQRRVRGMEDVDTQYYLALDVADRPGVLAQVAAVFGEHGVSIRSVLQRGKGDQAQLVLVTHLAKEGAMRATLARLADLPVVSSLASVMRVEGEEADEVMLR